MERVYLGDGLYANYDGYQVVITASNGVQDTNTVYLTPEILCSFINFVKNLTGMKTL